MRLYLKYLAIMVRSQMEYKISFALLCIGQFFVPFLGFIGMFLLFQRFGHIRGYSIYEVAICYSVTHLSFSITECFARGFDGFSNLVIKGEFDRILVRPRGIVLQVLGSRFELSRIGRMSQSILVMIIAIMNIDIQFTPIKILTLVFMVIGGCGLYFGIMMIGAALSFWTIEGLEIVNIFTDGGREISQYPLNIYTDFMRKILTFVIPFGIMNYLPLNSLLGKTEGNPLIYMFMPLLGIVYIIPCYCIWTYGIKHYSSTGS